ncbi:DUF6236 family protein [Pyruvatibacter sp.]|uniref:DUF6236 family protein n=1 Tax=Pyruvatibacter sp. TaxID=1981328 RepID=UPI0032654021
MSERGLIISPSMKVSDSFLMLDDTAGSIDEQLMKTSLLYWDKFCWPDQSLIGIEIAEDMQFLISAGIIERPMHHIEKWSVSTEHADPNPFKKIYLDEFASKELDEPGVWSMSLGQNALQILDEIAVPGRGAMVQLVDAIPVPDRSVPFQDILEFKDKRADELLALRVHLERVYQRILKAGDGELALQTEIDELQFAIADQFKAMREARFPLRLGEFSAQFGLPAAVVFTLAQGFELSMLETIGVSAAASLNLSISFGLANAQPKKSPFNYIVSAKQEL